jgi:hypothetical protein
VGQHGMHGVQSVRHDSKTQAHGSRAQPLATLTQSTMNFCPPSNVNLNQTKGAAVTGSSCLPAFSTGFSAGMSTVDDEPMNMGQGTDFTI